MVVLYLEAQRRLYEGYLKGRVSNYQTDTEHEVGK